jgi:hypothetical protein
MEDDKKNEAAASEELSDEEISRMDDLFGFGCDCDHCGHKCYSDEDGDDDGAEEVGDEDENEER